jgi:hypothetical protein
MHQELPWCHDSQPETLPAHEITDIVGDDGGASRGNRRLEDHVVLGVAEQRTPEEEDRLVMCDSAERIEHLGDIGSLERPAADLAHEGILVLDHEGYRDRDVERAPLQLGNEPVRRAIS